MCINSLSFSQYGIAQPMIPKNPHTNLQWTFGQQVSILHQLSVCSLNRHAFLPPVLMWYRQAEYSISRFARQRFDTLNLWAAHSFFARPTDPEVRVVYFELIDDLYRDLSDHHEFVRGDLFVRNRIKMRTLSPTLLRDWDSLLISMWILENHGRPHNGYTSYPQLLIAADALHQRSFLWCAARLPKQNNGGLPGGGPANNLLVIMGELIEAAGGPAADERAAGRAAAGRAAAGRAAAGRAAAGEPVQNSPLE